MTATSKILAENEVKKLATMLAPISFVFPPRKYPHKKKYVLCGVELEQARLNRYFRSGWIIEWRSEVLQTRHIYFRESEYVKYWAWLKGTFWIAQISVKTTAYTAIVRSGLEYPCAAWDPYPASKRTTLYLWGFREKGQSFTPTPIILQPAFLKYFRIYNPGHKLLGHLPFWTLKPTISTTSLTF